MGTLTSRVVGSSFVSSSMPATLTLRISALVSPTGQRLSQAHPLARCLCSPGTGRRWLKPWPSSGSLPGRSAWQAKLTWSSSRLTWWPATLRLPGLRFAKTQEDRVTKAKEMMEEFLPKWLAPLETILKKRGGEWYSGSGPTFAELAMMVALDFLHAPEEMAFKDIDNLKERRAVLDKYPLVKANYQRTCALPTSLSWKAKKPAFHGF